MDLTQMGESLIKIDLQNITKEQIDMLKYVNKIGKEHLDRFEKTMKHFKYPEKRLVCFDTRFFQRVVPETQTILSSLGQL